MLENTQIQLNNGEFGAGAFVDLRKEPHQDTNSKTLTLWGYKH